MSHTCLRAITASRSGLHDCPFLHRSFTCRPFRAHGGSCFLRSHFCHTFPWTQRRHCGNVVHSNDKDQELTTAPNEEQALSANGGQLGQLMAVIWCITLPLGYGGVQTIARLTSQDVNQLSSLQKASFVGASELLQLVAVLSWLNSRGLGKTLLGKMTRSLGGLDTRTCLEGVAGGILAASSVILVSSLPLGFSTQDDAAKEILLGDPAAAAVLLLSTAILAPVLEEVIYRGVLQEGLQVKLPPIQAILLSSFAFSNSHLSSGSLLPLTVLGIVFGFTYQFRVTSIARSALAHAVYNLTAIQLASIISK